MAAYTNNEERDTMAPTAFICPLTLEVMRDPVVSRYGQSYERSAILQWLVEGNTSCPMTRQNLRMADLISNQPLRLKIRRWQLENDLDVNIIMDAPDERGNRIMAYFTLPVHLQEKDDEAETYSHKCIYVKASQAEVFLKDILGDPKVA